MPKVSVIIPTWNGEELLKICLLSLKKQTFRDFEVIVVDNNSSDNSKDLVYTIYSKAKYIKLNQNFGFAKAVNVGIKKTRSKYLVLLNNDTKVDRDWLKFLVEAADLHPEVGMVASKMLKFYDPKIIDSAGDYIDAVGHADNIGRGEMDDEGFNKEGEVFLVNAGAGLFKRRVFQKAGFFDEDFFAYFEDVDLCFRAQLYGFRAWYQPKAVVYHVHKATSSRNRGFTEYLQFRNMTQTIIKNFPLYVFTKDLNWLKIILVNINTVRYLAGQGYLLAACRSQCYTMLFLPKILYKRWKIQSKKSVSDEYIYGNIKPKKVSLFNLYKKGI